MIGTDKRWLEPYSFVEVLDRSFRLGHILVGDPPIDVGDGILVIEDDRLVEIRDIMPTLLDMVDIPIPDNSPKTRFSVFSEFLSV